MMQGRVAKALNTYNAVLVYGPIAYPIFWSFVSASFIYSLSIAVPLTIIPAATFFVTFYFGAPLAIDFLGRLQTRVEQFEGDGAQG